MFCVLSSRVLETATWSLHNDGIDFIQSCLVSNPIHSILLFFVIARSITEYFRTIVSFMVTRDEARYRARTWCERDVFFFIVSQLDITTLYQLIPHRFVTHHHPNSSKRNIFLMNTIQDYNRYVKLRLVVRKSALQPSESRQFLIRLVFDFGFLRSQNFLDDPHQNGTSRLPQRKAR